MTDSIIVLTEDIKEATKILDKLTKKADKYEADFSYIIGKPYALNIAEEEEEEILVEVQDITVRHEKLIATQGWNVIAQLEHRMEGNIVTNFTSQSSPAIWHEISCNCEHCNTRRNRKITYIVKNEQGQNKQVGKTCLKDYTGIDPLACIAWADFLRTYGKENYFKECRSRTNVLSIGFEVRKVLACAYEAIKENGYIPTAQENSTKEQIMKVISSTSPRGESLEIAENILIWVKAKESSTDFIENAKIICDAGFIKTKDIGRIAYLPMAYKKDMERIENQKRKQAEESASEYVGNVKERMTFNIKSCELLTSGETARSAYVVTPWFLYQFIDNDNNVLVWFASRPLSDEERQAKTIKGTIKAHNERKGVKQTVLTRVKAV